MSTHRERREARAERLRDWAEGRDVKADAEFAKADQIMGMIPVGQPILVGHHSEGRHRRDLGKLDGAMSRAVEHARKRDSMTSRAANIEAQLDASIYGDDPDAAERLTERIVALEAERDRIKAYNASCRRGAPDDTLLTERDRADLATVARVASFQLSKGGGFPSYKLTNLSGNIARNRKRLAAVTASAS